MLITDVVDSTAIMERLGPERSKFLFDEIVGLMAEQVRAFDGTVAQLTGDGLLALFGAPAAHGDDAERAAMAALGIHEALAHYAADVADAYGIEIAARVAVNTGPVVVPARDVAPDVLYNALGDTVNVAARLQPHAGAGGVAVGPATRRELAGRFSLEPLGELELKGKAEPVAAFRIVGEAHLEVVPGSPLVGREPELEALVAALARLADGVGTIVSITGEPGIGKSRLLAEARARAGDVRVLVGNAASYSTESPFWAVRDLLRNWLGLGLSDPEARLRLELKAAVAAALNGRAERVYPFLASLLGVALESSEVQRLHDLSRDSVQRQTFEAVATLFEALAREQPLCLVFEDLHWADESTLLLVEQLFDLVDSEGTAVVLLYRSEREHGSWHLGERARQRFPHRLVELELQPLAADDSERLAGAAAGADLPGEVRELLAARSGGNPFFLEEALRDLFERGMLQPVDARWELTVAVDELAIPLLVQETLQARLDRLEPATREVVNVASVVGRRFGLPLLERMTDRHRLIPALTELQRVDLVVEERRRPSPEYRFRHGLVQEVAYASLTEAPRRELHLAAGRALEELHGDAPEEAYEALARHFGEAEQADKAVEYLLRAGDAAWALYADRDALRHYRRALEFMNADDERARDLLFKIALAHHLDFDFAQADGAWAAACGRTVRATTATGVTERVVTALPPRTGRFVPGHSYDYHEWWIASDVYSGLFRLARDLNVVPDAAAEIRVSNDGMRYRVRLRDDAVWSDGERVTAGDFVHAWDEIRNRQLPTAHLLEGVAEATASDDRTLEIRLRGSRLYFPYLLALPPTFAWPSHRPERVDDMRLDDAPSVSNGPFTIAEYDEEHALLVANGSWNGPRGNVGEVLVRFMAAEELTAAWLRGELDVLTFLIAPFPDGVTPERSPALSTRYVGFVADAPPFDDLRVRRAFAHAIDRNRWNDDRGGGKPATSGGFVPPAMPGHSHRIGLDYDPERARELLAEAGYPDGRGLPRIRIAAYSSSWAEPVADQWRRNLQARVSVAVCEFDDVRELSPPAACWVDAFAADFPDPAGFITPALTSRTGTLAGLYRDDKLLELLARSAGATNRRDRLRLFRAIEHEWLSEHVALVPLGYQDTIWLCRPWVQDFWGSPMLPGHLSDIVIRA